MATVSVLQDTNVVVQPIPDVTLATNPSSATISTSP